MGSLPTLNLIPITDPERKKTTMIDLDNKSAEEATNEVPRGDRGAVGEATPAKAIKRRWHEATHLLLEAGDKHNAKKRHWKKKAGTPSLRKFARSLLKEGDNQAKQWFDNKSGKNNDTRSDKSQARILLEKTATKAAKRK
jgi:hypothetical protein